MKRFRNRLTLAILALCGTLGALAVLEAGARGFAVWEERRQGRFERDLLLPKRPPPHATVTLGQVIRRSSNPLIVYELQPRLDVVFAGGRLTTSDAGYRGPDVVLPKPAGVYRIVGIGDSYMFGQGVSDEETYLARLPALMKEAAPIGTTETVNLAVPGYNTVMEVETLRARVETLQPDLVLIEIVGNDLDLPNFLWNAIDPWTLRRSFLLDFVASRLRRVRPAADSAEGLSEAPRGEGSPGSFSRAGDVPARYQPMVGLEPFEGALIDLAAIARSRRIPVMAITHGVWFEEELLRALRRSGIPVLVLRSALRQRARALGAPDYARSALSLSPSDLHPSALGHEAISRELSAWLATTIAR